MHYVDERQMCFWEVSLVPWYCFRKRNCVLKVIFPTFGHHTVWLVSAFLSALVGRRKSVGSIFDPCNGDHLLVPKNNTPDGTHGTPYFKYTMSMRVSLLGAKR
jgi:hypothetical protein